MANAKMNPKKTDRQIMEEAGTTFPEYMENLLSQLGEMGYTKVEISKYFHENYALSEWFPLGYTEVNDETLNGCDHQGQVRLFDPCITCGSVHHIWCPSCERHLCHDNYGNRINIQTNTQTVNMSFSNEINTPIQPNEVLKTVDVKDDPVNHPSHYTQFPVEIIEISRELSFNAGNVVKYVCRAQFKGKYIEDLEKAMWYLKDEIERLKKDACERFHPGEKCIPGSNHPSVGG